MFAAPCFKIKACHYKQFSELLKYTNNVERSLITKRMIQLCRKFAYTVQAWQGISIAVFNCDNQVYHPLKLF